MAGLPGSGVGHASTFDTMALEAKAHQPDESTSLIGCWISSAIRSSLI